MSFRLPTEMRTALAKAAKGSGRSVTQELLRRLHGSFRRDRDPALQALCYLVEEVAEGVVNPAPFRVTSMRPLWRSNPFLFRAFKLAVGKILDALEPAGEIKSPVGLEIAEGVDLFTGSAFLRGIYKTPETLADFVAAGISQALLGAVVIDPPMTKWDAAIDYGIEAARRDLQIKGKGRQS